MKYFVRFRLEYCRESSQFKFRKFEVKGIIIKIKAKRSEGNRRIAKDIEILRFDSKIAIPKFYESC